MKRYKAVPVTNTDTNVKFAETLEKALNTLVDEGYTPEPGFSYQNGSHIVIVGKLESTSK